jgi:NAD(P)-binding Rossmann-like domain
VPAARRASAHGGTFDKGITVLNQHVRALNLAWALVDSGTVLLDQGSDAVGCSPDPSRKRISVAGAGFAGLTVAAGLQKKRANAEINIFEHRDRVPPLQHGSDSRWLTHHIYDWSSSGSEIYSAALPVLNWTAYRTAAVSDSNGMQR